MAQKPKARLTEVKHNNKGLKLNLSGEGRHMESGDTNTRNYLFLWLDFSFLAILLSMWELINSARPKDRPCPSLLDVRP